MSADEQATTADERLRHALNGSAEGHEAGLDLIGVQAQGFKGRSIDLSEAVLEQGDLSGADLGGASLQGAAAGEIRLEEALLEDADFRGATMRYANLRRALLDGACFDSADLWGADLEGADADRTSFKHARLDEANLSDANLTEANFSHAVLRKTNFAGSRLRAATFADASLEGASFARADLGGTTLNRVDLSRCDLDGAHFADAWLNGCRMRRDQLGGSVGEERASEFGLAEASYLALERNFISLGSKDDASWAYKQGRRMGRRHAGRSARIAYAERRRIAAAHHGYEWAADRFVEWLCDYGESLSRIVRAFVIIILIFACLYGLVGGLFPAGDDGATRNVVDLISYSALNMLTSNTPDIGIKAVGRVTTLLVGVQGAIGIILMGLFGFVLGNRLRR